MKNVMITAVVCLGAAIGSAQSMERVNVKLPVAAKVGNVSLPAGDYSIRELGNSVIEISSTARKGVSVFATVNQIDAPKHEAADHTMVTLRKDADGYQVDKIWLEGQELGFELTSAGE
jgi:hypothetical protein